MCAKIFVKIADNKRFCETPSNSTTSINKWGYNNSFEVSSSLLFSDTLSHSFEPDEI